MSFKDFKIIETIGKGSFASVFKVIRRSDNKVYAMKRVKINKMSKKEIADALNEIRFLASIRHKNVVGFLEAFLENNETELCIVMEYCGCGDLAQKVERYKRKRQYIDEKVIWKYLIQSLKALQHLHEKGICHRDLKVANSFLAEDGSVKIGDMNVSKRLEGGQLKTQIGTPYYMSPEIWSNKPYDFRSDIWSLGCMIYELAALRPPFLGDSFPALKRAVTLGRYAPLPGKYSDSLSRVVGQMLKLDPRTRPGADALLRCGDITSKLQLDETHTSFGNNDKDSEKERMIGTIKVPQQLRQLNSALPKPCYPDVRPNSPTAWTVAEQKTSREQLKKRPPPLPPVAPMPVGPVIYQDKENQPPSTARESEVKTSHTSSSNPQPTQPPLAAIADFYSRRPMAPSNPNRVRPVGVAGVAGGDADKGYKVPGFAYPYNKPGYQPALDPILPPAQPTAVAAAYEPNGFVRQQRAPHRARQQYQQQMQQHVDFNRIW